jgi:hypothetical protein
VHSLSTPSLTAIDLILKWKLSIYLNPKYFFAKFVLCSFVLGVQVEGRYKGVGPGHPDGCSSGPVGNGAKLSFFFSGQDGGLTVNHLILRLLRVISAQFVNALVDGYRFDSTVEVVYLFES